MAVKHPPYHLRTNKAVDRLLLLKQVRATVSANVGLQEGSTYHSLGGPFMEDLYLMHRTFPDMKLVCIESDGQTHARQKAHQFSTSLSFVKSKVSEFLASKYIAKNPDIFWLDYTDLTLSCLSDLQAALRVLLPGSLIRITLNCESPASEKNLPQDIDELALEAIKQQLKSSFFQKFEKYIPSRSRKGPLPHLQSEFSRLTRDIVRLAISDSLDRSSDREFLHIHTARYSDGTPMISITGLVCDRNKIRSTYNRLSKQASFPIDKNWETIHEISVPILSIQERMIINKALPYTAPSPSIGKGLFELLNYHIVESQPKSEAALEQYAAYRNEYPSFIRLDNI